jgi:site-specific DNA-methyltransferase (cytosine-N4-specific)
MTESYELEADIPVVKETALPYPHKIGLGDSLLLEGDALHILTCLPDECIQAVITSPPYWGLRDYGIHGQIGLEAALPQYLNRLVAIFNEIRRVLKNDGILWLNIGDGYTSGNRGWRAPDKKNPARAMNVRPNTPEGLKPKDLIGVPWRLAFALQQDGWYLRSDIIWNKPNAMPESVKDRPTRSHEYIFMLTKNEKYFYDYAGALEESGGKPRNRRTVWDVNTMPFPEAHFATFPPALIEPCILSSSRQGDYVLDPFLGSGTVGVVSRRLGRKFIGIELNPEYICIAQKRLREEFQLPLNFRNNHVKTNQAA